MHILMLNEAHHDIDSIFDYIVYNSIQYANKTSEKIYSLIYLLEKMPYIGRYVLEICDKSFRELIYKNYRIVYQVSKKLDVVYVHFIVHGKRNFKSYYKSYIKNNF